MTQPGREFVLNVIVERKTAADFLKVSTFRVSNNLLKRTDGRFEEQKNRLKNSGHFVFYILEGSIGKETTQMGLSLLPAEEEINVLQVLDGFHVKHTRKLEGTVEFLATLTQHLFTKLERKTLHIPELPFEQFGLVNSKSKNVTAADLFTRQLLQIPGVSPLDAHVIVSKYPTPACLMEAYNNCEPSKRKHMLCDLFVGSVDRTLHPELSATICNYYSIAT